jgi:DNA-binding beta-propeller fold protein YncE
VTRATRRRLCLVTLPLAAALVTACSAAQPSRSADSSAAPSTPASTTAPPTNLQATWAFRDPLPGMPPVLDGDVYTATRAGDLSPKVRHDPAYIYVPDSSPSGTTVTVISQRTKKVVRTLHVGYLSQHVVPSYDLQHLYVNSSVSDQLIEINPRTGREGRHISVPRPYNLYFTPDGKQAVVMVEEHNQIQFSDPKTFRPEHTVQTAGCRGPNHADFSANGRFMVVTCEFSGTLLKVGTTSHRVLGALHFGMSSMPQDIRISPDGSTFYVADMGSDTVRLISARRFKQVGAIHTPMDPHGLYPSRDGRELYVSDRGAGAVSVVSFRTNRIVDTWHVPGGGSPDMGGVSADGKLLWLSGRYNGEVYAFNTHTGRLVARIPVPGSPHGLCVWPQPGRYSLGHTGNMR